MKNKIHTFAYSAKTKTRTFAFIDSQNLNLGVLSQGWALDYERFWILLKDKYKVSEAYLFVGYIPKNDKLYSNLQRFGYTVIFKPVLEIYQNRSVKIKGNIDAELVLHAMIEYRRYDYGIIVSGDGDFHCLVEYWNKNGKLRKIIVPNKKYSSLLRPYSQYIVNIDLFREKVERRK